MGTHICPAFLVKHEGEGRDVVGFGVKVPYYDGRRWRSGLDFGPDGGKGVLGGLNGLVVVVCDSVSVGGDDM